MFSNATEDSWDYLQVAWRSLQIVTLKKTQKIVEQLQGMDEVVSLRVFAPPSSMPWYSPLDFKHVPDMVAAGIAVAKDPLIIK
jgi:uncharacterized protein (DUF486 family)